MFELIDRMEPLRSKKNPTASFILGFFCGGIGLGIYFGSIIDVFIPFVILIGTSGISFFLVGPLAPFVGALLAGVYGYFRAISSNKKVDSPKQPSLT